MTRTATPDPRLAQNEQLLAVIREFLPELATLHEAMDGAYEDGLYRFYGQSFKVYGLQTYTERARELFGRMAAAASVTLDDRFLEILQVGTGKHFEMDHNRDWSFHTRPIVEAFLHARYFVEMMDHYGQTLETAPTLLPSGWAAILVLFRQR